MTPFYAVSKRSTWRHYPFYDVTTHSMAGLQIYLTVIPLYPGNNTRTSNHQEALVVPLTRMFLISYTYYIHYGLWMCLIKIWVSAGISSSDNDIKTRYRIFELNWVWKLYSWYHITASFQRALVKPILCTEEFIIIQGIRLFVSWCNDVWAGGDWVKN